MRGSIAIPRRPAMPTRGITVRNFSLARPTSSVNLGIKLMFAGDSETEGRTPDGTCENPGEAVKNILNENLGLSISSFTNLGSGGSSLAETASRYMASGSKADRTFVNTQESGAQDGDDGSQATPALLKATLKTHIRNVRTNSPSAAICYQIPNSFRRTGNRNWDPYEGPTRAALLELLSEENIRVYVAETNAVILAAEVYSAGGITIVPADVWYQAGEVSPPTGRGPEYHFTPFGNWLVALSILHACGHPVTTYTYATITDVTADQKTAGLAVMAGIP